VSACAGLPRAVVLSVGYGRALCGVAVDTAAAAVAAGPAAVPFAVSFVIAAAPVVRLAMPDASPGAAAATAAAPTPFWIQGANLHPIDAAATTVEASAATTTATLFCCFAPTAAAAAAGFGGGSGSRCSPAVAVSSALVACEPSTDVDAGSALLSVSVAAGVPISGGGIGGGGNGRGVSFEILGTSAVPIAAAAVPSRGPAEGGTYVIVEVKTVDGLSGGLEGADAPECLFGSIRPVAGRLASRGGGVACVSPAAAQTPMAVPVSARGRASAASWAWLVTSSFGRTFGTGAGVAVATTPLTALLPFALPLDHPALLGVLSPPPPGPGWNVIELSSASAGTMVVMVESAPRFDGVTTASLTLAGGGVLIWVRGSELASAGGGVASETAAAVLQRAHRSGTGHGSVAAPLMVMSSTVAAFEAPAAPPGSGPAEIWTAHPAVAAAADAERTRGGGGGGGSGSIVLVVVPESSANAPARAVPATVVTTEGGDVVTVATTLGAAASAVAACRVGAVGPMASRLGAGGGAGGSGSGEVECVVPARAPGSTTAAARPATASWPELATGVLTQVVVGFVPRVIAVAAAEGGLAAAVAADVASLRFTLYGANLPATTPGASCFARLRPSAPTDLIEGGSAACDFAGLSARSAGQGFVAVSAGAATPQALLQTTPPQFDVRAPPLVFSMHASSGPSGGGAVAHVRGAWSFGGGGGRVQYGQTSAGGEVGSLLCIFAGAPASGGVASGVAVGPGVLVSGAVASCEAPAWPGGIASGGPAAVSLTHASAEDATTVFMGSDSAAVVATAVTMGISADPAAASASFHYTPELTMFIEHSASSGPAAAPDAGAAHGGTTVALSGVTAGTAAAGHGRAWRCWFGSVGPVVGAASASVRGATCISPAHAVGVVPVRGCPTPSCGNAGDFGAAAGAVFSYAVLLGEYALVGGPAVGAADASERTPALFRLVAYPLRSLPLMCVVGGGGGDSALVPSRALSQGQLAECIPTGAVGAGFATVTLVWAGGDAAGAASGQVLYAPRPRVLTVMPSVAAAAGGGGAAPVAVVGSDFLPIPDDGGGWSESGGVTCVVGGRAAAAEGAWVSSALVLFDVSTLLAHPPSASLSPARASVALIATATLL